MEKVIVTFILVLCTVLANINSYSVPTFKSTLTNGYFPKLCVISTTVWAVKVVSIVCVSADQFEKEILVGGLSKSTYENLLYSLIFSTLTV